MAKSSGFGKHCSGCPLENGCQILGEVDIKNRIRKNPILRRRSAYQHKPMDYIEGDRNAAVWIVGLNPKLNGVKENETFRIDEDENQVWGRDKNSFKGDLTPETHGYFKSFKRVSSVLWKNIDDNGEWDSIHKFWNEIDKNPDDFSANFAHTDLVCCATTDFPPKFGDTVKKSLNEIYKGELKGKNLTNKFIESKIIEHCGKYLEEKIKKSGAKLIVGVGKEACVQLVKTFICEEDCCTIKMQKGDPTNESHIEKYIEGKLNTILNVSGNEIPIIFSTHLSRSSIWDKRRLGEQIENILKK